MERKAILPYWQYKLSQYKNTDYMINYSNFVKAKAKVQAEHVCYIISLLLKAMSKMLFCK